MADGRAGHPGAFSGATPAVGEIRAVRTFRVERTGTLLPLAAREPWRDGVNSAVCAPPAGRPDAGGRHRAPDPDCRCGFYAYGAAAVDPPRGELRYVQAVVACWGRVVAGTRGIRSEHARIEALWLSPGAPPPLVAAVARRYPSVRLYADRAAMLAEHPPTALDCYDGSRAGGRGVPAVSGVLVAGVLALGLVPPGVLTGWGLLAAAWTAAVGALGSLALWTALTLTGPARRTALPLAALACWLLAPIAGWPLRVPALVAAGVIVWHLVAAGRPDHFPVQRAPRRPRRPGRDDAGP